AGGVAGEQERLAAFLAARRDGPIARHTAAANRQHYEVPAAFFRLVLGQRLKYSSAYWPDGVSSLDAAEEAMLELTCRRAGIEDGQRVLDLGCGWGALTFWLAERYPRCRIVAVSNSRTQREWIEAEAARRGAGAAITVLTADMNELRPPGVFDRI